MKQSLEARVKAIEVRNGHVEKEKAWETSVVRRLAIAVLTYAVIVLFFFSAGIDRPLVNAIVPTLGYVLSTLSLGWLKRRYLK